MNRLDVKFLDLPNEILLIILKKLNNIDVLYSLLNIDNERLNILAQEKIFSNTLDFVSIDDIYSNDHHKLDRFRIDILPRIHHNVRCFILEPVSMERILLAADYPNLTELKLFNFKQEIALSYFTNESPLRYIFQQQITDLILASNDESGMIESPENYTKNVYGHILSYFKNLKHFSIIETFNPSYPPLSLDELPSTTFFSSTLTHLCINMYTLDDCLYLLDGRLKQLTSFIVQISYIDETSSIIHNMDDLPNLKCFSFICYLPIAQYDQKILPLLRRMSYLEKLTLYLRINGRDTFIDSTHLENEILVYMPQLHSFTFYICTYNDTVDSFHYASSENSQRSFTNIGQQRVTSIVNYISNDDAVFHIFSLPFVFDHIEDIGNIFPDAVFKYVTYLLIQDVVSFEHEFFIRVARSFPLISHFRILNLEPQTSCITSDSSQSYSIAEYPHLTSLDVRFADTDYLEQFLDETKACVPCLTELTITYNNMRTVTKNFTRKETRRNCAKVKQLIMMGTWVHPKDFYVYFPLL